MPLGEGFATTLAAARLGAEWAWGALYDDLAPAVTGYLRARGAPEPDDLTGEVFLQIVRDLRGFSGNEREFRSWVFTITHHRLLDTAATGRGGRSSRSRPRR
ncbi:MAG: RNA polymerase sigma factor [Actinomycetota bacterium]